METIRIAPETMPQIESALELALKSDKSYQVEIKLHDNSLKARQRALAVIWYKEIADQKGLTTGEAEAFCKYHYGFRIRCGNDVDLENIIRKMLDGHDYEQKLKIIEIYPEWFPVLRDKGGMDVEQQGLYLGEIQRGMGQEGIFLTSPNEKEMLSYPEASK